MFICIPIPSLESTLPTNFTAGKVGIRGQHSPLTF
jgi:hypothetical protein